MRITTDRESPDFVPGLDLSVVHVFCDGRFLPLCVAFDDAEGWADVIAIDPNTERCILEVVEGKDRAKIARLHGRITYRNHGQEDADKVQAHRSC